MKKEIKTFIIKILIFMLFILIAVKFIFAVPITLDSVKITTADEWCINKSNRVDIQPIQLNNATNKIDDVGFTVKTDEVSYQKSVFIYDIDTHAFYLYVTVDDFGNNTEMNISAAVLQSGKIVSVEKRILLDENCDKSIFQKVSIKVDEYMSEHKTQILTFFSLIFFVVLVIISVKLATKK